MNFLVVGMYGSNGLFYGDTKYLTTTLLKDKSF